MRRVTVLFLIVLLLALALTACGGDDNKPDTPPAPTTAPTLAETPTPIPTPRHTPMPQPGTDPDPLTQARLRVVHASAELPAVDLYLDGEQIGWGFTQGEFHAAPLNYTAGNYLLRAALTGDDPDTDPLLLAYPLTLDTGTSAVAILVGSPDDPQVILYHETLDPLPGNTARLSVIHAVPRGAAFTLQDQGRTLLPALDYGGTGGPLEIASGPHTLSFTSGPDSLTSLDMNLSERRAYTLLLLGDAEAGTYDTISFFSQTHDVTSARVIHASPNLPDVDVYLGDILVAEALSFGNGTDWDSFRSLGYDLRVLPAGNPDAGPLLIKRVTLIPNKPLEIVLLDEVNRLRVVTVDADLTGTPPDMARFIFVHAATSSIRASIGTYGGLLPELQPISFGTATRPTLIGAGNTEFLFQHSGDNQEGAIDRLEPRDWIAGHAYTIVFTGVPDATPFVFDTEVGIDDTATAPDAPAGNGSSVPLGDVSIRVIHGLDANAPIDVDFDGARVFDAVEQGTGTPYTEFSDGVPDIVTIRATSTGTVLIEAPLNIPGPGILTLFVFRDDNGPRLELVPDLPYDVPGQQASLRVLHAAPNKPDLTIFRQPDTVTLDEPGAETGTSPEGEPTPVVEALTDRARFGVPSDTVIISAGTYTILIEESDSGILALAVPDVIFESRGVYDLLLLPDSSGLSLIPILVAAE
ncbi:MAG: DUF4397 domain-containing protein [Anaerolineae bacterium]|nr:DUF4397 domain-containing protein [Anaerolineae bacterium]